MTSEELRLNVIEASREYFKSLQKPEFIPGKTYIPASAKVVDSDDLAHLINASLDLWLTAGRFSAEFESQLPKLFNRSTKALAVNSGSSANLVAISALSSPALRSFNLTPLEKGDEVITVAAGFPTTVNPIIQNGWIPVFVDVDIKTLNALPEKIMEAKSPRTKAIILAHTLGNPYRADILSEFCKKEGLYLIEDCCDAFGSLVNGQSVGSFGEYATLSFYPAHHITMGEGGAILSKDGRFRKIAESFRDWGRDCWCEPGKDNTCKKRFSWALGDLPYGYDHKYTYSHIGYNLKITDMQAALGISQLKKVDSFICKRKENWKKIYEGVKSSPILNKAFDPVEPTQNTNPSWFGFAINCREGIDRKSVTQFLEENKVGTRLVFAGNLTKQPAYKGIEYKIVGNLNNTDQVMNKTFWIGVHPAINDMKIEYMLEQLEKAAKL